ncbi:MAG: glycosyltransferase family 39 protein [Candidatus Daviesbacteria bacterium]
MKKWIKENKTEVLIILLIILLASFLRFYRLSEYMTFLGDEGRDALMIQRILVEHDLPLVGPPSSVGNIYLGPLYYYMMIIPMAIFWLNPVAATGMVAVLGVAAVILLYFLARRWFGFIPAIFAATLYAISPVTIIYSRSSWNPNPTPFFTLLAFLGLYLARLKGDFRWLILTGVSLAAAIQMHYLALILIPIFVILWIYEIAIEKRIKAKTHFLFGSLGAVVTFIIIMLPLIVFDFRYNFMNFHALMTLFTDKNSLVGLSIIYPEGILSIYINKLIGRYMAAENNLIALILAILTIIPLIVALKNKILNKVIKWPYFALGVWLIVGLLGLLLYKKEIYDHYLGFLSPAPFLLVGGAVNLLKERWQIIAISMGIILLGSLNLLKNPLLLPPNNQLTRTQEIAKFVINESKNKPFNFALLASRNYDSAYQFYLDLYGHKPKVVPVDVTDQLFVVCEDENCNPVVSPKYEIAAFGMTKVDWENYVAGVKVYRLVANPEGK